MALLELFYWSCWSISQSLFQRKPQRKKREAYQMLYRHSGSRLKRVQKRRALVALAHLGNGRQVSRDAAFLAQQAHIGLGHLEPLRAFRGTGAAAFPHPDLAAGIIPEQDVVAVEVRQRHAAVAFLDQVERERAGGVAEAPQALRTSGRLGIRAGRRPAVAPAASGRFAWNPLSAPSSPPPSRRTTTRDRPSSCASTCTPPLCADVSRSWATVAALAFSIGLQPRPCHT